MAVLINGKAKKENPLPVKEEYREYRYRPAPSFSGSWAFMSTTYPSKITVKGLTFKTAQAAYESLRFVKRTDRAKFVSCQVGWEEHTGRHMKAEGCEIDPMFESNKIDHMRRVQRIKFKDSTMRKNLLNTKNWLIVYRNRWKDFFWGEYEGKGENRLGIMLMELRKELGENSS